MDFLTGILLCGWVLLALSAVLLVRTAFYTVYRARCPKCGHRTLRFDQFQSDPWRRGLPGPIHRWVCGRCGARRVQVAGIWDDRENTGTGNEQTFILFNRK